VQYKVPQNVQLEDKILPFVTLRQLIVCMVGGGFTYLIYLALETQSPPIWVPPVFVLGGLTLAIAFLKIRDIPFVQFMLLVIERYLNETKRVWIKSAGDQIPTTPTKNKKVEPPKNSKTKTSSDDIDKISKMVDQNKN
jgi:hypothetical protein